MLGKTAEEDVQAEVEVAAVGERSDDAGAGREDGTGLLEQAEGIAKMLEDVGADHEVEAGFQSGEASFEVGGHEADRRWKVAIHAFRAFDAGDVVSAGGEEGGEVSVTAAEVEDAAAFAGSGQPGEQERVAAVGRLLERIVDAGLRGGAHYISILADALEGSSEMTKTQDRGIPGTRLSVLAY